MSDTYTPQFATFEISARIRVPVDATRHVPSIRATLSAEIRSAMYAVATLQGRVDLPVGSMMLSVKEVK